MRFHKTLLMAAGALMGACNGGTTATSAGATETSSGAPSPAQEQTIPSFSADSAYSYVKAQTDFGPRVPGSPASEACGDWLVAKLGELGAVDIKEQRTNATRWDGVSMPLRNISASVNPGAARRVLLLSHWDSRPWADMEDDPALRETPIDGANDGASGVAVILEVLRAMRQQTPQVGVDILFVDAEDSGRRADMDTGDADESSWAVGTQHWVAAPTLDTRRIDYAVLLDMVGGKGALFPREYYSEAYARDINDKVQQAAARAGHTGFFPGDVSSAIVDDHIYLLKAGIPAVDIIETRGSAGIGFNPTWHTHADNIDNIDPATLQAVGETLMQLIYYQ